MQFFAIEGLVLARTQTALKLGKTGIRCWRGGVCSLLTTDAVVRSVPTSRADAAVHTPSPSAVRFTLSHVPSSAPTIRTEFAHTAVATPAPRLQLAGLTQTDNKSPARQSAQ